jgi:hypothetical protein
VDRRQALLTALAATAGATLPALGAPQPTVMQYGASAPPRIRRDRKSFHRVFRPFEGVSGEIKKNVFLYHHLQKELGEIVPHDQSGVREGDRIIEQGEGDCVGHAAAMGADILAATNIHLLNKSERFIAKASVEMSYAGSRIEVGRDGRPNENPNQKHYLAGRGGSHGSWAANYLQLYGVLHRKKYTDGTNSIDLTGYSPARSRKYRDEVVPNWLEPFAREHPVLEITNVHSGQEALDAVCAGQPVIICSSYAFQNVRDKDGFCAPYLGSGWFWMGRERHWGRIVQWWHAMILTGAILEGPRVGGIIQNSHGKWNSGPQPYGMPDGAFGVDLRYLDLMVKDWYDCYALSCYHGHEAKKVRHKLYL